MRVVLIEAHFGVVSKDIWAPNEMGSPIANNQMLKESQKQFIQNIKYWDYQLQFNLIMEQNLITKKLNHS